MKATGSPPTGRFQRRPSLGTSIARAMISMSPDVTFDMLSEKSTSLSIRLCESIHSSISRTSCFSPSTAISNLTGSSSSTLHSSTERNTTSNSQDYQSIQFNLLEIPDELNLIFNRLDAWQEPHNEQHIIEISRSTNVIPIEHPVPPLNNTETSSFMKYIQENTNMGMKWDRLLSPIKEPFTNHISNQQQIQLALSLFKLILRFVNISERDFKQDRALGDYIVQMGLMNEILRDEILIQIINQIWNNIDLTKLNKSWLLMSNCLSCFSPSSKFYKYLSKFISEENPSNHDLCKQKLLAAGSADTPRTYPPTQLEWSANKRSIPMALQAKFSDNIEVFGEVESWITGEEYAYELVSSRGILKDYCYGWTVSLEDDDNDIELMGYDYLLDLISELEIPPCSPVCKSFFLIHDGRDRSSKTKRRRNHRTTVRSKEWFLKIDNARSSRLSKTSRRASSSNRSSPYKYPKHLNNDDQQQQIERKYLKHHSPLYYDVNTKKSNSSLSSFETTDDQLSFPPPPPTSLIKDILKTDATSVYSIADDIPIQKNEFSTPSSSRSSKEKLKNDDIIKPIEKRVQLYNQSTINKTILKPQLLTNIEHKESIHKTNVFTSSSHSMVDPGCGGHILSKIPALRCLRSNKQHHTQKFHKTSPLAPPKLVVSDYNGPDHPTSFYGEFSICSDGPANLNQYEKIGSSVHHAAKPNGHNEEYHISSIYSDGDIQDDISEYETETKRTSPGKDISKPGTKFIKNKTARPKSGYPQAKKQGNTIFDSESIATITDLPLPCHKGDVEAFLDDLFDRALDPKKLGKKKNKSLLSTFDQRRLQMISNSRVDPSARRRGLANLLHKKSTICSTSINDQKKIKNEKNISERKKRTKTKKKRHEQLNTNNNNNIALTDNSFTSFTSEYGLSLPQIGYTSRTETDEISENSRYIRGPKHKIFHRQPSCYNRRRQKSMVIQKKTF